ncbi:DUF2946 domain-containing protein [Piscinibacter sp.]|uniref:DUF2946 domain-containing protein n=1 Tax=Piscinibacter sp. TaxID=1903157 RepID=UPI0039E23A5C
MSLAPPLHTSRTATLRRWVLACVLMAWGAAWAAPLLQPGGLQVVCSASGHLELVATDADGHHASHADDCAQCAPSSLMGAPPPAPPDPVAVADGAATLAPLPESTRVSGLPPARGPPIFH